MTRYTAVIRVRIDFDAPTSHDAERIAEKLADQVSIPTPQGCNAEFVTSYARVKAASQ